MKRVLTFFLTALALWLVTPGRSAFAQSPEELPLPAIPSNITSPQDRADYLVGHFWDALNFSDTAMARNIPFVEQAFSNFISVFPYASEEGRSKAVETLVGRAEADSVALSIVKDIAEIYLYEPASPVFSEEYYLLFLQRFADSTVLNEAERVRTQTEIEDMLRNRPGNTAPNFTFTTLSGTEQSLYDTETAPKTLLFFFDPDCDHCEIAIETLRTCPQLDRAIKGGEVSVVAIYPGDDVEGWRRKAKKIPSSWIVGINDGTIDEDELYDFPSMPTIYLLDSNKTIVIKEMSSSELGSFLESL